MYSRRGLPYIAAMGCLSESRVVGVAQQGLHATPAERDHLDTCESCRSLVAEVMRSTASNPKDTLGGGSGEPRHGLGAVSPEVGRYRLERLLGEGAMGEVWAARDTQLDRSVALKILRARAGADPGARERLLREARAMARLSHPNVVGVFDAGVEGDTLYFAMELVEGRTLREWLRERRRSVREVLAVFLGAGRGLQAAHAAGIVHRDFKPENVLIDGDDHVFVGDFGLARSKDWEALRSGGPPAAALPTTMTRTGVVIGTPAYMAPEQHAGKPADARADVFSFCVALFEALHGLRPFAGETAAELHQAIERQAIAAAPPGTRVPAWLQQAVLRGLKANPEERWPSLHELLKVLDKDRRRLLRLGALAAALVAAIGLAFAFGSRVARVPIERPAQKLMAMLELKNRSGAAESAWLSTAIGELVSAELHAAGGPRIVPGDEVARMHRELQLAAVEEPPPAVLGRVRDNLRADYVVSGGYLARAGGALQIELHLIDSATGRVLASAKESGREGALFELASRAGTRLRAELGMPTLSPRERDTAQVSLPSGSDAARSYARALLRFRAGDLVEARKHAEEAVRLEPLHAHSHLLLARVLYQLGYRRDAGTEARRASELADQLEREDQLAVELTARELASEWDRGIEVGRALVTFYPLRTDYALSLASVEARAHRGKECLATIASLRKRAVADPGDPRIDFAESVCAESDADFEHSRIAAERGALEAERRGARLLAANNRKKLGWALARLGRQDESIAQYSLVQAAARALGDRNLEASALNDEATVYGDRRDAAHARPLLERALEMYRSVGNRYGEMAATNNLATNAAQAADRGRAHALYLAASALAREVRDSSFTVMTTLNAALLDAETGQVAAARRGLEEARAAAHANDDRRLESAALLNLCQLLQHADDLVAAAAACDAVEKLWAATSERSMQSSLWHNRATLLLEKGSFAEAEKAAQAAVDAARGQGSAAREATALAVLGEALWARGRHREATKAIDGARLAAAKDRGAHTLMVVAIAAGKLALQAALPAAREAAARELAALEEQSTAGGWVNLSREIRLALGEAMLKARKPGARELLASLEKEAGAAGDLLVVRKVARLTR